MQAGRSLILSWLQPLYGYTCGDAPKFRKTSVGNNDIYYPEEEEVDFETILNKPLPKIPHDVSFTAHWLAIEGVQPAIPQIPHQVVRKHTIAVIMLTL